MFVARSTDPSYKLEEVKLPFPLLSQHSYTILDLSSKQVFIHVTHSISGITYGNVYKSDSRGISFVLSARNNVKNEFGYCDFERIKGMRGIYLINHYDSNDLERASIEVDMETDPIKKSKLIKQIMMRKSSISFDRGNTWTTIRPPVTIIRSNFLRKIAHVQRRNTALSI